MEAAGLEFLPGDNISLSIQKRASLGCVEPCCALWLVCHILLCLLHHFKHLSSVSVLADACWAHQDQLNRISALFMSEDCTQKPAGWTQAPCLGYEMLAAAQRRQPFSVLLLTSVIKGRGKSRGEGWALIAFHGGEEGAAAHPGGLRRCWALCSPPTTSSAGKGSRKTLAHTLSCIDIHTPWTFHILLL